MWTDGSGSLPPKSPNLSPKSHNLSPKSHSCLDVGARLWIPCEKQVWCPGVVVGFEDELGSKSGKQRAVVEVQNERGCERLAIDAQAFGPKGRPSYLLRTGELLSIEAAKAIDDLSLLPMLVEPEILHSLYMRYSGQNIYTFAGQMLLAVNPYQEIPGLYDNEQLSRFANVPHGCPAPMPHIFSVARDAFLGIKHGKTSQTVLVSGESGSGKTETVKLVLQFLVLAGGPKPVAVGEGMEHKVAAALDHQVLESAVLLESLGNARTSKNDNASRFSKFVELHFQYAPKAPGPCVMAAETHTYLLETMRVTDLHEGQRSFHIFYQILAAAARASMSAFQASAFQVGSNGPDMTAGSSAADNSPVTLSPSIPGLMFPDLHKWTTRRFMYLARLSTEVLPRCDEAMQFDQTLNAMRAFEMTNDEISQVVSSIVAVLHLGNIEFQSVPGVEASVVRDASEPDGPLCVVCALLGVDSENLAAALCTRTLQVHGKSTKQLIPKGKTAFQAADSRDALARHLYGMLFKYVVSRINQATSSRHTSPICKRGCTSVSLPTVGVLDIFGFENFNRNCFEQFCINFANEVLQRHYTNEVFEQELALYGEEGILFDPHEAAINVAIALQHITDSGALLAGVFPVLDEESAMSAGSSASWLHRVTMKFGRSNAFRFVHHPKGHFIVHHFAGPVEYSANEFLEKNKDVLSAEALECMQRSTKAVLQELFTSDVDKFDRQASWQQSGPVLRERHTISSDFRDQLDELMRNIQATRSHFVRCIKPNHQKAAHCFDSFVVLEQLRYQGVLEATRVARAAGFMMRLEHKDAVVTYWRLAPRVLQRQLQEQISRDEHRDAAQALFVHLKETLLGTNGVQVGKTLTFFKGEAMQVLGLHIRKCREGAALQIQTVWRRWQCVRKFVAMCNTILKLQTAWRRRRCARRFATICNATLTLQTFGRVLAAQQLVRHMRREHTHSALKVQAAWRRQQCLRRFAAVKDAVVKLQRCSRRFRARRRLQVLQEGRAVVARAVLRVKAVLCIQRCFRKCLLAKLPRESSSLEVPPKTTSMGIPLAREGTDSSSSTARRLSRLKVMIEDSLSRLCKLDPETLGPGDSQLPRLNLPPNAEVADVHASDCSHQQYMLARQDSDAESGTSDQTTSIELEDCDSFQQRLTLATQEQDALVCQPADIIDLMGRDFISRLNTLASSADGEDRGVAPRTPRARQNSQSSSLSWWQSWLCACGTNVPCRRDGSRGLDELCDSHPCPTADEPRKGSRVSL